MKRSLVIMALVVSASALMALGAPSAQALEVVTGDQFAAPRFSARLTDPDEIVQQMNDTSRLYGGGSVAISRFGDTTIGVFQPSFGRIGPNGVGPQIAAPRDKN